MSQATGWSANFDFGEALKNAVANLPEKRDDSEFAFQVKVTDISADFSRGPIPPRLIVTVERVGKVE